MDDNRDFTVVVGAEAFDAYDLKPGERWVTTKNGHHVVINDETGEIVHGSKGMMKYLKEVMGEVSRKEYRPANMDLIEMFERAADERAAWVKRQAAMPKWGNMLADPKWSGPVEKNRGKGPLLFDEVYRLLDLYTPGVQKTMTDEDRRNVAVHAIGKIFALLHHGGRTSFGKPTFRYFQQKIGESYPAVKRDYPEFFHEDFYDAVVSHHDRMAVESNKREVEAMRKLSDTLRGMA